jgi:hypothetical protein
LIQGEPALTHAKSFEWVSLSAHHTSATRSSVTRRALSCFAVRPNICTTLDVAPIFQRRSEPTTFGQVPTSRREDMSRERDRPRTPRTRFPFGPRSVAREGKAKADAGAPVNAVNQRSSAESAGRSRIVRSRAQPTATPRGAVGSTQHARCEKRRLCAAFSAHARRSLKLQSLTRRWCSCVLQRSDAAVDSHFYPALLPPPGRQPPCAPGFPAYHATNRDIAGPTNGSRLHASLKENQKFGRPLA